MKIAIIGSRNVVPKEIENYIHDGDEIVSGGAKGVDRYAAEFAKKQGLKLTEFLPQYDTYGRGAPIVRNYKIVDYCDEVIAFWDGTSKGTRSVIEYAKKTGKPCRIILCSTE